jgi:hypothetical protein
VIVPSLETLKFELPTPVNSIEVIESLPTLAIVISPT